MPDCGPTVASRTAMVVGGLLIKAARRLRAEVEAATGGAFARRVPRRTPRRTARPASTSSSSRIRASSFDDATYRGDAYPAFGWAACVAAVDVDLDTGEVHVRDVVAADDIGTVIHPVLAEGQVEGGTLQAVGYATIEEIKLRDGRYLNDRLATYIIPTALDAPRISTILVEAPFSGAPHGAKGVGELPMDVGAPAVVAAIADATGVWIADLPASPERILAALPGGPPIAPLPPGAVRTPAAMTRVPASRQRRARSRSTCPGMRRLLDVLREDLGPDRHQGGLRRRRVRRLHGPLDGAPVDSCLVPVCQVDGADDPHGRGAGAPAARRAAVLDTLQQRSCETGGAQCGICTPGMLMAAPRLPRRRRRPRRGRDPRGDRRQPLPLHGLHQDRRGHRARGRQADG